MSMKFLSSGSSPGVTRSPTHSRRRFKAPPTAGGTRPRSAPSFSVVVATYNSATSVPEAVESALGQTLPPLEVIVCDDGSTDDTAAVLEPYRDRITYLRREHRGVASARNAALEIARAEFFAVLDADDIYLPQRLEALADLSRANPGLDLLCTDIEFEVDGRIFGRFTDGCPFEIGDQRAAVLERCFCAVPAVRRTTLLGVGGYDESLRTAEDWDCVIRLIHAGAAAGLVEEPLYRYRLHADSLTADRVVRLRERVAFLERYASDEQLRPPEREALERSLAAQRRSLLLTEAEASLRARDADARRQAFAVARSRGIGARERAGGLVAAMAPELAARILDRRSRAGRSRLGRSHPRGE
jgi:Glycosyl transferase family 2